MEAILEVMEVIEPKNITFNLNKCSFGSKEIKLWGMLFSSEELKLESEKIKSLEDLQSPKNIEELKSFTCMMQSNSKLIPDTDFILS